MDLVKIGAYIAGKRKALGLTQKQVAEKLGMSDKSVSKWERGVCLPDVSVYLELCDILGITINEFLAGEDIPREDIPAKSEDNLIQVTQDSQHRQRKLKRVIAALVALTLLVGGCLGVVLYGRLSQPQNYIQALDPDSPEVKTAELLSGSDGAALFQFHAKEPYHGLTIYLSQYRRGELVSKTEVASFSFEDTQPWPQGMIALVPDHKTFEVTLLVTDGASTYTNNIPILEGVNSREYYGRSFTQVEGQAPITYDTEQGLMALAYGEFGLPGISMHLLEEEDICSSIDDLYYFSVEFTQS